MAEQTLESIKKALEAELSSTDEQLADHGVEPNDDVVDVEVDEGFADSAQATSERGELLALVEQLKLQRQQLVRALGRIETGEYGTCENCGKEIPIERLQALPSASLCVACKQEEHEQA